jgi:hypothetical protein
MDGVVSGDWGVLGERNLATAGYDKALPHQFFQNHMRAVPAVLKAIDPTAMFR